MMWVGLLRPAVLRWITRGVLAVAGSILVIDGSLAVLLLASHAHAASALAAVTRLRRDVSETRRTVQQLGDHAHAAVVHGSVASGLLKRYIDSVAEAHNTEVTEFKASDQSSVFMTRYTSDPHDSGWSETPVRAVIVGEASAVVATLQSLRGSPVPTELNSVEFTRASIDKSGKSTVSLQVDLSVLIWRANS